MRFRKMNKLAALIAATIGLSSMVTVFVIAQPTDPTSGVLPAYNDAYANWTNAGLAVIGGIPARNTQCGATVNPTGITPPAANDDLNTINAAIAACPAGQVVQLGAGTFQIAMSEYPILINNGITLRGTGNCSNANSPYCGTVINTYDGPQPTYNNTPQCGVTMQSTTACPFLFYSAIFIAPKDLSESYGWAGCPYNGTDDPTVNNCGTPLAADAAQGQTTVQVASTANFTIGGWVLIDESPQLVSTTNPTGGSNIQASSEFLNTSGSPTVMRLANPDGTCNYSLCTDRVNQELHRVTAIGPGPCPGVQCTLTFDDPLTMAFRQSGSHDARAYWPVWGFAGALTNIQFLTQAGVENLSVTRANNGAITFQDCAYCWIKGVEARYWINGAVNVEISARVQVTGSYFHDCIDCQNDGAEYPVAIDTASTEVLLDNNIIRLAGKGMVGRAANTAVVAYNYVDDTFYQIAGGIGDYWVDMGVNGSHYAGTHHFLFEGNSGDNCDGDETHGNAIYHTFFRNQCTGLRTTFTDPSLSPPNYVVNDAAGIGYYSGPPITLNAPGPLRAAGPMAFNYWYAFVGNVLGLSGVTTSANGWIYNGTAGGADYNDHAIWISGWTGQEWPGADQNLYRASNSFIFRHGDYDYVNASIADWTLGYSHTLPNSFYLMSQPPYFGASGVHCTYPWPWVTPTAGSVLQTPTGTGCTSTDGLPAKARWDAGTPFVQP
jgi:hypothetical protein